METPQCNRCDSPSDLEAVTRFGKEPLCSPCRDVLDQNKLLCSFVRCNSHRAREKLFRLIGFAPKCYWSWEQSSTGGFYPCPNHLLEEARKIPGITKLRDISNIQQCWS